MKNILKSTLLLMCGAFILASCADDNDSNPVLQKPTSFVLNTPALATNGTYDLANSTSVELTCTQPNYGFPITTNYTIEVATKADMSNATKMSTSFKTAKIDVDAAEMAAALTEQALKDGKTEADFPIDIPVYIRAKATPITAMGSEIDSLNHSYAIESNVITLKHVHLAFSLPPVNLPEHIYITGNFNNWSWDNPLDMVMVNGSTHVYWHLVYIDDSGIKFNTTKKWDGNEKGFAGITINASSELGSEIKNHDGNIASSNPGWYLMIVLGAADPEKDELNKEWRNEFFQDAEDFYLSLSSTPWCKAFLRSCLGYPSNTDVRYMTLSENKQNNKTDSDGRVKSGCGHAPRPLAADNWDVALKIPKKQD